MKLIVTASNIAQENLALEEVLLKDRMLEDDVVMFYINKNCIIIGRNQNVWEEINGDYVEKNKINIARRMSGGGAVYQDLNNVCFSFITGLNKSCREFLKPVLGFFNSLGLDARFHGKNDVHVNGFKVSGNAQFRHGKRVVHHGTVLFRTNLSKLSGALKPNKLKMESKGIKSVRQRVANLYDLLPVKTTTQAFVKQMVRFFETKYKATTFDVTNYKVDEVAKLTALRSSTDWVYGKNPAFAITNHKRFPGGTIKLTLDVEHNKIVRLRFSGDFLSTTEITPVVKRFVGANYNKAAIWAVLEQITNFDDYFGTITKGELLSLFLN